MYRLILVHLGILLLLSSCRLGPSYRVPGSEIPSAWKAPQEEVESSSQVGKWWEVFQDCTLDGMEEMAVANSPSLQAALERVFQAWSVAGVDRAALYPQATLNPSYSDTGELFKIFLPPGLAIPGFTAANTVFRIHQFQYLLPLNMSYEIDLWGKLRGQYQAAVMSAQAQEDAYCAAILTLTTDLASNYFQMRSLDAQIDVLKATMDARQKALQINESRFKKGLGTDLDVASANLDFSNAEAAYKESIRQRILLENAIAVLMGVPASEFKLEHSPLKNLPPKIPAGVPGDVILQRPDIAEAERIAASQHALIGVAYANFFPSLSLTGALGYESPDLKQFLKWKSRLWSLGANAAQTIFDAGRNSSNLSLAWAQFREASDNYQQTVLTAFREVEDALNNLEYQAQEYKSYTIAAEAGNKLATLTHRRYLNGLINYIDVIVADTLSLTADINQINMLGQQYLSTIQLIKALGGTWRQTMSNE